MLSLGRLALGGHLGTQIWEELYDQPVWLTVQATWFMLNTDFPSGSQELCYVPAKGCLRGQPQGNLSLK